MGFASNGFLRAGDPIGAILRAATQVDWNDSANSEDVVTLAGDRGATKGIRSATVSGTFAVPDTGTEIQRLTEAFENGTEFDLAFHAGRQVRRCRGTIKSLKIGSTVNKMIEFSMEFSGAPKKTQNV